MDILAEKNRMYEEMTSHTKELLGLNATIHASSVEAAKFKQEVEFLRTEYEEKEKIINQMRDGAEAQGRKIALLREELEGRQNEMGELQGVLREALEEGKELDGMIEERDRIIAELEAQLKGFEDRMQSAQPEKFVPQATDDVDVMLFDHMKYLGCEVPIKRLGGGYYMFGTRKIYAKIMNGKLVIRVGGGYMVIEEFIQTYAEIEMNKILKIQEQGGDPFAVDEKGSPVRWSRSPKTGTHVSDNRSPTGRSPGGRSPTDRSPRT